jgi:hypothetical protein
METVLMVFLLLAGRGAQPPDLLSLLNVDDYFLTHPVQNDPTRIADLAGRQSTTPEEEVDRLLAIRWLGEHRIVTARETLQKLARRRASDPYDLVGEYAERALARLEPSVRAPRAEPWLDLRNSLRWFPSNVSLVGAIDLTAPWARKPLASKNLEALAEFARANSPGKVGIQELLSQMVRRVGNIRLERLSVAWRERGPGLNRQALLIRVTGRWQRARLARYFTETTDLTLIQDKVDRDGVPRTVFANQGSAVIALIGDNDCLFAESGERAKSLDAIEQITAVRLGRARNVFQGPLAAELRSLAGDDDGLLVGEPGEEICKQLDIGGRHVGPVPDAVIIEAKVWGTMQFRFQARMKSVVEATMLLEEISSFKTEQINWLRSVGQSEAGQVLIDALQSIRLETDGASVRGSARLSLDLPWALAEMVDTAIASIGQAFAASIAAGLAWLVIAFFVSVLTVVVLSTLILAVAILLWRRLRRKRKIAV